MIWERNIRVYTMIKMDLNIVLPQSKNMSCIPRTPQINPAMLLIFIPFPISAICRSVSSERMEILKKNWQTLKCTLETP